MSQLKQRPASESESPAEGRLPNLIVIGAMKCGTTSLHYYLNLHPQIRMSANKELKFFITEFNWPKGLAWYRSNFTGVAKIYGESSPRYTSYPLYDGVPERMASIVPQAKLIYLVRDPIERLIADFVHHCATNQEHRPIAEALADLNPYNCYVQRSLYNFQLEQYLKYFPAPQILVITQEALQTRRRETLQQVFRFLEVDDCFYSPLFAIVKHRTRHKRKKNQWGKFLEQSLMMRFVRRFPPEVRWHLEQVIYRPFSSKLERPGLAPELQARLKEYFAEDVQRLHVHTGCAFEHWSL